MSLTDPEEMYRERIHRGRFGGLILHWSLPSTIVGLLILGLLGSFLHHRFYRWLDGERAEDQFTATWFGNALAFLTKAALVGSITLAYRQRIWYTLRTKAITIKGIDNLFTLTENPVRFYSKDVLVRAGVATVVALATWIIPFAAAVSPGALTARLAHVVYESNCTMPTLNTSAQSGYTPRKPKYGIGGYDLVLFNKSEGLGDARPITSPCRGYNCTLNIIFDAPWYECQEKSAAEARKALDTMDWKDIENRHWAPRGPVTVFVVSEGDEYAPIQPPYRDDSSNMQSYFMDEPTIRVGYVVDTNIPVVAGSTDSNNGSWKTIFELHWLSCDLFKASWNMTFNFTGGARSTKVKTSGKRRVFQPPKMGPGHPDYRENALYYGFGRVTRDRLSNGFGYKDSYLETMKYVSYHPLDNSTTRLAISDPKGEIEKYVLDMVLTFLSTPYLESSLNTTVECKRWRYENRFHYNRSNIWIGYAIGIFATLVSVFIGMHYIYLNGIASDTLFSKVFVTTRNPTLDKLVKEYEAARLAEEYGGGGFGSTPCCGGPRFGIIDRVDEGVRTASGTVGETEVMLGAEGYRGLESHKVGQEAYRPIGRGI
ncbi:hypothetical protein B9Z19DRAFT_1045457 [Tuber borchii]|uniref:Uncharacterized protein n=1 Tax=Tuber borchii TaxID=42251 RepID=A0A2T6ZX07_TUBBO|nr:hypothetical protein B9Z19DRAFT_1045457 [Tuber borchii]